ncbi:MAG: penicillin-binding protein 2 [Pseudomonadota bacterium]
MSNRLQQMAANVAPPSARSKPIRVRVLAFGFALAFIAVTTRVGILSASGLDAGSGVRNQETATAQPILRDVNGDILARTLPSYSLAADPKMVLDPAETARLLKRVLPKIDVAKLTERLDSDRRFIWVARHLTPTQSQSIHHLGLPGLSFRNEGKRVYMQGRAMSHVLGFRGIDGNGLAGLEAYIDESGIGEEAAAADGFVDLTLDGRLQHVLRNQLAQGMTEFGAKAAAGVVLHLPTGGISAMVSLPDFDPYGGFRKKDAPLFNHASKGTYELGSIFKILNTAIALESGTAKLGDRFDASKPLRMTRFTIRDFHPQNRWLTVAEAFKYSSNIASAEIAMKMGEATQQQYFGDLGLLDRPSLELVEVGTPLVPPRWSQTASATISFGHGISVSPVQMASAVAAAIHDGVYRPPTLLKSVAEQADRGEQVFSPETTDAMRRLLRVVVTEGTGKRAEVDGYLPGGKTGTAELAVNGRYDSDRLVSSFVAGFPIHSPEYVVLVTLIEPQGNEETHNFRTAGWVAAPIVSRVIEHMAPLLGIVPVDHEDPVIQQAMYINPKYLPEVARQ